MNKKEIINEVAKKYGEIWNIKSHVLAGNLWWKEAIEDALILQEKELNDEWLNKLLPEQLDVSLKQKEKEFEKMIDEIQKKGCEGKYNITYVNADELKSKLHSQQTKPSECETFAGSKTEKELWGNGNNSYLESLMKDKTAVTLRGKEKK